MPKPALSLGAERMVILGPAFEVDFATQSSIFQAALTIRIP
jgi:hypothetical protein